MGRRHFGIILFIAVWLVVLSVPTLRLMWQLQIRESTAPTQPTNRYGAGTMWQWYQQNDAGLGQLAAWYPNDVRVQSQAIESTRLVEVETPSAETPVVLKADEVDPQYTRTMAFVKQRLRRYDELIQRFPNVPWLIAGRLRMTTRGNPIPRRAGELDAPPPGLPQELQPQYKPSPLYSHAELEKAIDVARIGRRLEPHNCFYDFMLSTFLFALYRDREALQVLHEGGQKPHYDDHIQEALQISVAVRELDRPLLFEEKLATQSAIVLPHYAIFRNMASMAVWQGIQAARAGDHRRALQIYGDVARLGARMRQDSKLVIGGLVGIAIEHLAWRNQGEILQPYEDTEVVLLRAQEFADYATKHGRPDLAREARREGAAAARYQKEQPNAYEQNFFARLSLLGYSRTGLPATFALWWTGVTLLPQLALMAVFWSALALTARIRRRDSDAVVWPDVASAVILSACITGGLVAGACMLGAGSRELTNPYDDSFPILHLLRWLIVLAPIVVGALYCLTATWWRQRKSWRATLQAARATRPTPEVSPAPLFRRDITPLLKMAANWLLTIGTIYAWLGCFLSGDEWFVDMDVALLLTVGCLVRWAIKWFPVLRVHPRSILGHSLQWYRQTLGAFIVLSSVVYLALLLISLPLRRAADATMDDFIQRGEIALLSENQRSR